MAAVRALLLSCFVMASCGGASITAEPSKLKLNDGGEIPAIALGTFLGFNENGVLTSQDQEVVKAVEWAIDAGYRHVDTAAIYLNEQEVGLAINNKIKAGTVKREDIFLTTKLWNTRHAKEQVVPALREALALMKLDYVDLFLVHWPVSVADNYTYLDIDYLETWKGMEEAKTLGLAKHIGISNFNEAQITRLLDNCEIKPSVLEVEVNPNLTQEELVSFAQDQGLVVMGYSPFGSLVASRSSADSPAPKIDDPTLLAIAKKYGKTTPQVVLRYLLERKVIPIPKSVNKSRIEQNIDIFDFQLTPEEVAQISAFNINHRIVLPSFWQNHPHYPFEKVEKPLDDPFL